MFEGRVFTVTKNGRVEEWFTRNHINDRGATKPRPWYVNIFMSDKVFNKYHNREVNKGNSIAKERNA